MFPQPEQNGCPLFLVKMIILHVNDEVIFADLGNYYQSFDKIIISPKHCIAFAKMLVSIFPAQGFLLPLMWFMSLN